MVAKKAQDALISALCFMCVIAVNDVFADDINFVDSGQNLGDGRTFSIAVGDVDGDDDLDAFITHYIYANRVWLNDGTGTFIYSGQNLNGQDVIGISSGDVDGDGDIDVFLGKLDGSGGNKLYFNQSLVPTRSTSWGNVKSLYNRD
jgi:hypothetical protein